MVAFSVSVAILSAVLFGCIEESASQAATAEMLGMAIGEELSEPLLEAASGNVREGDAILDRALDGVEDLPLPDGVEGILVGRRLERIVEPDYAAVSMSLIVIPEGNNPTFCILVAVASDGRVVTAPSGGNAKDRCGDSSLIDMS